MEPYIWATEEPAIRILLSLSRRRQLSLLIAIEHLARHPFQQGNASYCDSSGTEIRLYFCDGYFLHYALDHAVRKVRIVEIEASPS